MKTAPFIALVLLTVGALAQQLGLRAAMSPPYRVSNVTQPLVRVLVTGLPSAVSATLRITLDDATGPELLSESFVATPNRPSAWRLSLRSVAAGFRSFVVSVRASQQLLRATIPAHVVATGLNSTLLVDGAFLDLLHWSDEEAPAYNPLLKQMTAADWRQQIASMAQLGIRTAVVQALYLAPGEYVVQTNQTCDDYHGLAMYPAPKAYPREFDGFVDKADKVEAILDAADQYGVSVFLGDGLFAWFDFTPASLCWHKRVLDELLARYGKHASLAGIYVSEELFGSFYYETPQFYYPDGVQDVVNFFAQFKADVAAASPMLQIAFAPNSQHFDRYLNVCD